MYFRKSDGELQQARWRDDTSPIMIALTRNDRSCLALWGFCAALIGAPLQPAAAQRLEPAGISRSSAPTPKLIEPGSRPRARTYVLWGTVAGVTAMVGALLIYGQHNPSDVMNPFALVPAVLGAGLVGGVAGYVVYRVRY